MSNWKALPWEEGNAAYLKGYTGCKTSANDDFKDRVDAFEKDFLSEWNETNEESFEGDLSEQIGYPKKKPEKDKFKAAENTFNTEFLERYSFKKMANIYLPQIITYIGSVPVTKNRNGKVSGLQFRDDCFDGEMKGLYRLIMLNTRSKYLSAQTKSPAIEYSALVPLVLYAQKMINRVPYSAWDRDELHWVVNSDLCEAMLYDREIYSEEFLAEMRRMGSTYASGEHAGKVRNPLDVNRLTGLPPNTSFKDIPHLVQIMFTQVWMAHPSVRKSSMVLDPFNWDKLPEAFSTSAVMKAEIAAASPEVELPW